MSSISSDSIDYMSDIEANIETDIENHTAEAPSIETPPQTDTSVVIYEQPMNELMRSCLRLEYLFKRIDHCLEKLSIDDSAELIVKTIIDILDLLDRPDLKSRLTKEFHRHYASFSQWLNIPNIDKETLEGTLKQLEKYKSLFLNSQTKIANSLRAEPFVASIRQHFNYPGDCYIDSPQYVYWLHQAIETREQDLHGWLDHLSQVRSAVNLLLKIVRDCTDLSETITERGFYYQSLNPESPCQLIRIGILKEDKLYPEISAGRHRMSVRFLRADTFDPPLQSETDVTFQLACCAI